MESDKVDATSFFHADGYIAEEKYHAWVQDLATRFSKQHGKQA